MSVVLPVGIARQGAGGALLLLWTPMLRKPRRTAVVH
jgi:hypothetical protein